MSLFRRFFYRRPPDGLLEITERVYVFDSCFSTDVFEDETYKIYMRQIATQLHEQFPVSSFLVFNFREGEKKSQLTEILSLYDMTVMDYPRQYEGCPLLSMEMLHHFLRSSDSWLSLEGHQNIVLMHCERGGWPLLAFILSCFLIYRKLHTGEQRTLDMLHREAPKGLLHLLSPLNPMPSQLRYLQYVARRNNAPEWPPPDRSLTLDCLMLRVVPSFDSAGGCRPLVRIYGRDTHNKGTRATQMLFSLGKKNKLVRHYRQVDCDVVKIEIQCPVQGDVVLECIHLEDDSDREEMMFRVMFNTAFIRSNILILYRDDIDILWDAKERFTKDFRAEVLFGELDTYSPPIVPVPAIDDEDKGGLPIEAFARVQELFNSGAWDDGHGDAALRFLQQQFANVFQEKMETSLLGDMNGVSLLPSRVQMDEDSGSDSPPLSSSKAEKSGTVMPTPTLPAPHQRTSSSLHRLVAGPIPTCQSSTSVFPLAGTGATSSTLSPVVPVRYPSPPGGLPLALPQVAPLGLKELPNPLLPPSTPPLNIRALPRPPPPPPPPPGRRSVASAPLPSSTERELPSLTPLVPGGRAPPFPGGSEPRLPSVFPCLDVSSKPGSTHVRAPAPPPCPPPPAPPPPKLPLPTGGSAHPVFTGARPPSAPGASSGGTSGSLLPTPPPLPTPLPSATVAPGGGALPNRAGGRAPPPPPFPIGGRDQIVPSGGMVPPPPPPPPLLDARARLLMPQRRASVPPAPPPPGGKGLSLTPGRKDSPSLLPPNPGGRSLSVSPGGNLPPPPPPLPTGRIAAPQPTLLGSASLSPAAPGDKGCSEILPPPPPPSGRGRGLAAPPPPPSGRGRGLVAPPLPPGGRGRGVSLSAGTPVVATASSVKKATLKPLHWVKVTRAVQGSLWAENQKQEEQAKGPEIDMSELESLFSNAVLPPATAGDKVNRRSTSAPKQEKIHLIDLRRANNCEIMLTKIKMPMQDMLNAVLNLDGSVLDMDQVENLIKFCPTKEEIDMLKGFGGDREMLGKAEQFFLEMMRVPRMEAKLRVFAFKISFISQVAELRVSLVIVNEASREVRESVKLRRVMQTILSLGNALNQGTARGSAIGFKLDSLLKLTDTRARNNKMTLMHYLCKVVGEKLSELLDFHKDLIHLEGASKIQLKSMTEEMQAVSKGLEKIEQELTASENDGPISDSFREVLKAFLNSAEAEVRSLASLYSEVGRNADSLAQYFGEDPARCPFEQVTSILLNFVIAFKRALEDNIKQAEIEKKKADKEAEKEKIRSSPSKRDGETFAKVPKVA